MSQTPVRTLLLSFSPEFGAPPIALVATHRDGFGSGADALRAFVLAVYHTSEEPRDQGPLAALAALGGFTPRRLGKQLAALNDLGWAPGEWSDHLVHVNRVDELLQGDVPGFSLREEVPGLSSRVTYLQVTATEKALPIDLGGPKGPPDEMTL